MASLNDSLSDEWEWAAGAGNGLADKRRVLPERRRKVLGSTTSMAGPSTAFGVRRQTPLKMTTILEQGLLAAVPFQWKARPAWARKGEPRVRMGVRATSGRWLSRLSRMAEAVQWEPKSWRAERSSWKKALRR